MYSHITQLNDARIFFQTDSLLRFAIPREKRGIEEFDDEEFLTRKTGEKNEKLTGLKKTFLGKNIEKT